MLQFAANLSLLWADQPLPERFARAAAAGFRAVELWWPGADDAARLPALTQRWGLDLALLNFDAGDMAAGDRGLAADPARAGQLRANVPLALRIAADCGGRRLNLLVGVRDTRYPLVQQLGLARDTVAWAADLAAAQGAEVMIEALNTMENGPCLLTTTEAAAGFIAGTGRANVRLQYDAYHMQRMEGDLTAIVDAYWDLIGHIQIADVPGRGEPGTGEINYRFFLGHLGARGYRGHVGLEYRPATGRPEDSFGWLADFGWPRRLLVALPQPVQSGLGDLAPAVVDGQGVPPVGEFPQVGDRGGAVVEPAGLHADLRRDGVVPAARRDQQRPPGLVAGIDLRR
jgi:hydroxypyruvate isomerase